VLYHECYLYRNPRTGLDRPGKAVRVYRRLGGTRGIVRVRNNMFFSMEKKRKILRWDQNIIGS